jgi:ABC-type amino acid transport substrate-binding protein
VEKKTEEGGKTDPMANKTFIITAILNDPYTMLVESHKKLSGNARFEGFAVDLAAELAGVLGFNFTFKLVDDGQYGKETSPGKWNGMLGEVMDGTADFCIADISITAARTTAFAFTMPWMNLGISILYVKPRAAPPSLIAFLEPFTTEVYICTLLAFILVTLLIYVLARFSPNQWEEPDACVKDPEEYSNQFNLCNSSWFVIGALMQQGSDIVPISLCVRFISGMWYFFALIMIASYTANLAAFLTVETLERPIESVEALAAQEQIKYGAYAGGSTAAFFENSNNDIYKTLWQFMSGVHQSEVMLGSNLEGVKKVEDENGKYAFFMESASIQYLVERLPCKLSQVGGLLDSKGYGIVTRPGTPYKALLDNAILQLLEGGTLHRLKIRWWKQKRGGGACDAKGGGGGVKPLGLANVAGVFLVTMIGCAVAGVIAILEFLYGTKQAASDSGVSWAQKMREEIEFFLQCVGNTRELGVGDSDSDSSKSAKSHSSHLSLDESPSDVSGAESHYRTGIVESPYSHKSCSTKLGSQEDHCSKNGNPFHSE